KRCFQLEMADRRNEDRSELRISTRPPRRPPSKWPGRHIPQPKSDFARPKKTAAPKAEDSRATPRDYPDYWRHKGSRGLWRRMSQGPQTTSEEAALWWTT